jgi:hypothetical protein
MFSSVTVTSVNKEERKIERKKERKKLQDRERKKLLEQSSYFSIHCSSFLLFDDDKAEEASVSWATSPQISGSHVNVLF